jgi:hypothetical protein
VRHNSKEREMKRDNPDPEWGSAGRLKEVLDSAGLDEPSRGDLARLRGRLAAAGIGIAAVSAGKTVVGLGIAAKITIGIAVTAGISVGTLYLAGNGDAPPSVSQTDSRTGTERVKPRPLVSGGEADLREASSPPEPTSAPEPETTAPQKPLAVSRRSRTDARQTMSPEASVRAEAELLHRARGAMKADPEETLSLVRQHAQRYPDGVLAEERDFLAINALKRLSREKEACERAARFIAAHPRAAQVSELTKMCEKADTSAGSDDSPVGDEP